MHLQGKSSIYIVLESRMKSYHVYALGNALVDMEFEVEDQFLQANNIDKGVMTLVEEHQQHELMNKLDAFEGNKASGGSAANSLIAVAGFGGSAFYSCRVSNDDVGDYYMHDLHAAGIDSNLDGNRPDGISGKCLVMITPDAERTMNTFLGISSELESSDINEDALIHSEFLYMEGYLVSSPTAFEAALKAKEIADSHKVKTALTFSDPAMVEFFHDGLTQMIGEGIDLLFCNEAEAMAFTRTDDLNDAVAAIKSIAKTFAITLGSNGALVYDGNNLISIEPHKVKAVDTNGAGDMFAGAFLYAITHGYSYKKAGQLASLASSRLVTQLGPRLPLNEYKELFETGLF